jgi:hypothetical protein
MARRRATEKKGLRFQVSQERMARRRTFNPVNLMVTIASLLMALLMTFLLFNAAFPNLFWGGE